MLSARTMVVAAVLVSAVGCTHKQPSFTYMPDMAYGPSFKSQEPGAMRLPVKGTVPRDHLPYAFAADPEAAGRDLSNPLPRTKANFMRGKQMFETYCLVCHGPMGEGDGPIIPKFARPPSLQSDKVMTWTDGRIYHVITVGQNLMPSYAQQVEEMDRWAIIHYVRALQRAKHPTAEDLKAAGQES